MRGIWNTLSSQYGYVRVDFGQPFSLQVNIILSLRSHDISVPLRTILCSLGRNISALPVALWGSIPGSLHWMDHPHQDLTAARELLGGQPSLRTGQPVSCHFMAVALSGMTRSNWCRVWLSTSFTVSSYSFQCLQISLDSSGSSTSNMGTWY